jgi:hypothetical protein
LSGKMMRGPLAAGAWAAGAELFTPHARRVAASRPANDDFDIVREISNFKFQIKN